MEYIVIIAVVVVILAFLFLRKGKEMPTDYVEPTFKASGHQWAFNGILDIDCPPKETAPFLDGEGELQLMVKKGFVHYDLQVNAQELSDQHLGMFRGRAFAEEERIVIRQGDTVLGCLPAGFSALADALRHESEGREAYGFIARKGEVWSGEVCIAK